MINNRFSIIAAMKQQPELVLEEFSGKIRSFPQRHLPLLDHTQAIYRKISLEEIYLICAQHVVSSTYSLLHALFQQGLDPENFSIIGKCYSTDPRVANFLQSEGLDLCPSSLSFNSHKPFDDQYQRHMKKFLESRLDRLAQRKYKKIVILDDGGELLVLANKIMPRNVPIIGIEQTSSGYRRLESENLRFPVINMARSEAKLRHESPIIAKLVSSRLQEHLPLLPIKPGKILVIGRGAIGAEVVGSLGGQYEVDAFDIMPGKNSLGSTDLINHLHQFNMIIGCTGKTSLPFNLYSHLQKDGVVLVSASSSDREFEAAKFRQQLPRIKDCHQNLSYGNVHLLNCGFPINFDAGYDQLDGELLQLTRSLLLISILQASSMDMCPGGLVPLDMEMQRDVLAEYFSLKQPERAYV